MSDRLRAHVALINALKARDYHFITTTPLTHARMIARRDEARDLRDVFGWSLPFRGEVAGEEMLGRLQQADALTRCDKGLFRSRLRASSLQHDLFLHSAYPTVENDAVFFGPDTYRFAAFLDAELPRLGRRARILDFGAGSGAGAVRAADHTQPEKLCIVDINDKALALAEANLQAAGLESDVAYLQRDKIAGLDAEGFDLIVANPPYIADPTHRLYRDGGAMHGAEASLDWARQAAECLRPSGVLLLYTGSAIVGGEDRFKTRLHMSLPNHDLTYRELDPDVFGEELERPDYADVERIAVVGVVATRR